MTADQATIDEIAKRPTSPASCPTAVLQHPAAAARHPAGSTHVEWNLDNIRAPEVWGQFGARGEGIVVANIDTGVQFDHPALVRQYRGNLGDGAFDHNYNWFDPANVCGSPSTAPCDNDGHGTHTMGTMVGDDGAANQIGVAPAREVDRGQGLRESTPARLESLLAPAQWVLAPTDLNGQNPRPDLRPHIVNNSWGGGAGRPVLPGDGAGWVAAGHLPGVRQRQRRARLRHAGSPGDYSGVLRGRRVRHQQHHRVLLQPRALGARRRHQAEHRGARRRRAQQRPRQRLRRLLAAPRWRRRTSPARSRCSGRRRRRCSATSRRRARCSIRPPSTPSDLSCGGTPENNNVYGRGPARRLRRGRTRRRAGRPARWPGTVTTAGGAPIAGAIDPRAGGRRPDYGQRRQRAPTTSSCPSGTYTVTVSAFGYVTQAIHGREHRQGVTTTQDAAMVAAPSFAVSGTVVDSTGVAVVGGQVTVVGHAAGARGHGRDRALRLPVGSRGDLRHHGLGAGRVLRIVDHAADALCKRDGRLHARSARRWLRVRLPAHDRGLPAGELAHGSVRGRRLGDPAVAVQLPVLQLELRVGERDDERVPELPADLPVLRQRRRFPTRPTRTPPCSRSGTT